MNKFYENFKKKPKSLNGISLKFIENFTEISKKWRKCGEIRSIILVTPSS